MIDFVEPFVSAIGLLLPDDNRDPPADHYGSGAFLVVDGIRYLLTCEHVANHETQGKLGCDQFGGEGALSLVNHFTSDPYPVDAAASPISANSWTLQQHSAKCIVLEMVARQHRTVQSEYLFVYGFPDADVVAFSSGHQARGVGVFGRECGYSAVLKDEVPEPIDGYHIFLPYSPEHATVLVGSQASLSEAKGLSGSLLWNTRYREMMEQGLPWHPADSMVTGIVWGNSKKGGVLVATPIQHLLPLLNSL